jgi:hypothetical protein
MRLVLALKAMVVGQIYPYDILLPPTFSRDPRIHDRRARVSNLVAQQRCDEQN